MNAFTHPFLAYFLLLLYSAFSALVLIYGNAPILAVALVLYVAPMIFIWQYLHLRTYMLVYLASFTVAGAALLQAYAYTQGLWYEIAPSGISMFGTGPVESYVFAIIMVWYLAVLYEYFFDDGLTQVKRPALPRKVMLVMTLLAVTIGYLLINADVIARNGFAILIGFLCFGLIALLTLQGSRLGTEVIKKAMLFSVAVLPVSLVGELILLENNIRFFAHISDYAYVFNFFSHALPLEEVLLLVLLPMWLVVLYELLLDDAR